MFRHCWEWVRVRPLQNFISRLSRPRTKKKVEGTKPVSSVRCVVLYGDFRNAFAVSVRPLDYARLLSSCAVVATRWQIRSREGLSLRYSKLLSEYPDDSTASACSGPGHRTQVKPNILLRTEIIQRSRSSDVGPPSCKIRVRKEFGSGCQLLSTVS